jgi:hypothetical protein
MISRIAKSKGRASTAYGPAAQEAIHRADGRCQMCGRTAAKHGTTLAAEKRLWADCRKGGTPSFWAICLECRDGVRAYLRSLGIRPETLRRVSSCRSIHARIGELLRAFGVGRAVPSSLISSIAGVRSWKARLRELRQAPFNWKIMALRRKEPSGRWRSSYVLLRVGNLSPSGEAPRARLRQR